MAIKPTALTDWANSESALKTATDSNRWNLGWQTLPDNLPNQTGERPNLNQQNYWQNAVHLWSEYYEESIDEILVVLTSLPDNTVTTELDLWEWDLDTVEDISTNVGTLIFFTGSFDSGTNWDADNQSDGCFIGYWHETMYNFRQGVSLRLIDNADVVWLISPVAGVKDFYTETVTIDGGAENGSTRFTFIPNAKIEIRKDDVIVTDFSTFSTLANRTEIDTQNPTGLRAISREVDDIAISRGIYGTNRPYKRKRFRAMIGSAFHTLSSGTNNYFTTKLIQNQRYRIKITIFKYDNVEAVIYFHSDITDVVVANARLAWLPPLDSLPIAGFPLDIGRPQYYEADFRSADNDGVGFLMSGSLRMVNHTVELGNFNISDFMDGHNLSMFTIEETV